VAPSSSVTQATQVSLQNAVTPLWIHVSIEDQTVTVYDANNQVVESWLCSTGSPGYDTPRGTFSVYYRCSYFWNSTYQEGADYAVEFVQHYYLHSVPLDKSNNIIQSIANELGHEDSHGCVHLAMADSKWIYDNIPNGTKVVVD
jgi:lipoprotein-anchoring transpeptidase ErfK/SrfK